MTYPAGEALALNVLQDVDGFDQNNTSRGKWGILNSGNGDHYGIVKPGSFERQEIAISTNETDANTIIQVWQRYKDDGDSLVNLEVHVNNIIAYFDKQRKLKDTTGKIVEAFITSGREVQEQWTKDGGLSWLSRDVIVTWQEQEQVTYAE